MHMTVAGLLMLTSEPIWACKCIDHSSPSQELANSAAVFEGYVVDISLGSRWVPSGVTRRRDCRLRIGREGEGPALCLDDDVVVTIEVTATWKGVEPGRVRVRTPAQGSACGFPFRIGLSYLVYASRTRQDADLGTSICHPTKLRVDAQGDLKELGPPARDRFSE